MEINTTSTTLIDRIEYIGNGAIWDITVEDWANYQCAGLTNANSGKTYLTANRVARFCLWDQPPPRKDTPFWIISDSYDQCMGVCWKEKLRNILPPSVIDEDRIVWMRHDQDLPFKVPLKPWPDRPHKNWQLEFKSYEQGRDKMQARSIGGFWFSEQFPWSLLEEVIGRCRDYWYDGGGICEFTPIDPDLSYEVELKADNPPKGWEFFRLNTDCNDALKEDWKESFFDTVSDEMIETRRTGARPGFKGLIYKSFNPALHVLDDAKWTAIWKCSLEDRLTPVGVWHRRGTDWGESLEHPFVMLWAFKDGSGNWWVYDEFVDRLQMPYDERGEIIKTRWPWPKDNMHYGRNYADPSRPGLINDFNRWGIPTSSASNSIHKGIETVASKLKVRKATKKPSLYIYGPNCPNLLKSLRKYRWLRSSGEGLNPRVAKNEPLKRDDDEADALRYMIHSEEVTTNVQPTSMSRQRDYKRNGVNFSGNQAGGSAVKSNFVRRG